MNFLETLEEEKVIIADGAMGTSLYSLGIPKGRCFEELNISEPNIVQEVHRAFREAGAEIIETNTFGANRLVLDLYYGLGKKTKEINYKGAKIAKEAGKGAFVAGSVGPITRLLNGKEEVPFSQIEEIFSEQITSLLEGGVDLIIIETMSDIEEAKAAINAVRKENSPFIVSFSFSNEGRTLKGFDPEDIANFLKKEDVEIMGVNCGSGPQESFSSTKKFLLVEPKWLSAMPNAGLPRFIDRKFIYPYNPEYFLHYAKKLISIGVSIIGGCCGTTPQHIKMLAENLKGEKVVRKKISFNGRLQTKEVYKPKVVTTTLKEKTKREFILIVELEPPRGTILDEEIKIAKELERIGITAVSISDSPMGKVRMDPLALAHRIKEETSLEVILHKTTRDKSILGLQSECLSISALGIENILALTGDTPTIEIPILSSPQELTSKELIRIIKTLNSGKDIFGNPLESPTNLWVGAALGVELNNIEISRMNSKIELGAEFFITQPVFDLEKFIPLAEEVKKLSIPIFAGVMPLLNSTQAEYLHNEVPGISIPMEIRKRADKEGIKIAKEIIRNLKEITNGVCLMLPKKKIELLKNLLDL
ncbi:MAG: bifunctional homocysteine S-methyltransferase/methylenetetrahydrofolate reductase [candidate division WOR-3 bacterium]